MIVDVHLRDGTRIKIKIHKYNMWKMEIEKICDALDDEVSQQLEKD